MAHVVSTYERAYAWTPQKENNVEWRQSFVLKHFSVNDNATAWKYIDLLSSAVRQFSESERFPEDGQLMPKHVATDAILTLF
jgi:hypothetical protein